MIIASLIRGKLGPIAEAEYRAAAEKPRAMMLKIPPDKLAALNEKWGGKPRQDLFPPKDATREHLIDWRARHPGCAPLRMLYQHFTGKRVTCAEDKEEMGKWWRGVISRDFPELHPATRASVNDIAIE